MLEGEKDGSFFLKKRRPPRSTLFPDTTLFRYDVDRLERRAERAHDLAQQVVGHRPGRAHALLLEGDRRRLDRRSEEHTSELQSRQYLVCRLLLEKKHISLDLFYYPFPYSLSAS